MEIFITYFSNCLLIFKSYFVKLAVTIALIIASEQRTHVLNVLGLSKSTWLYLSTIYTLIFIEFSTKQVSFMGFFLFEKIGEVTSYLNRNEREEEMKRQRKWERGENVWPWTKERMLGHLKLRLTSTGTIIRFIIKLPQEWLSKTKRSGGWMSYWHDPVYHFL